MDLDLAFNLSNKELKSFTKELKAEETPKTLFLIASVNKYKKIASKLVLAVIAAGTLSNAYGESLENSAPNSPTPIYSAFNELHKDNTPSFRMSKNPIDGSNIFFYQVGDANSDLDQDSKSDLQHYWSNHKHIDTHTPVKLLKELNKNNAEASNSSVNTSRYLPHDDLVVLGSFSIKFEDEKYSKYSDEFTFFHEIAHSKNKNLNTLYAETSSDIFATLSIIKHHNMNKEEAISFSNHVSEFRKGRSLDPKHLSTAGLEILNLAIENDLDYHNMSHADMDIYSQRVTKELSAYDFSQVRKDALNLNKTTERKSDYITSILCMRDLFKDRDILKTDDIINHPDGEILTSFTLSDLQEMSFLAKMAPELDNEAFLAQFDETITQGYAKITGNNLSYNDLVFDADFLRKSTDVLEHPSFKASMREIHNKMESKQEVKSVMTMLKDINMEMLDTPDLDSKFKKPKNKI